MAKRTRTPADPIAAARAVARAEVAKRWPELAEIEPTMTLRAQHMPAPIEIERLGAAAGPAPQGAPDAPEYTFTFAGHTHTPDGYVMPRIARITVDSERRVVKATTSK
jgi:hypothetical protein